MKKSHSLKTILAASLLVLLIFTTIVPLTAFAYLPPDFSYRLEDRKAVVTDCRFKESKIVEIPKTIEGYTVVGIDQKALRNSRCIEEIILPKTITFIGDYAFSGLTDLKKINLPDSLLSIGAYAFENCTNLTKINIPSNVHFISPYAFHTTKLKDITVSAYNNFYTAVDNVLFNKDKTLLVYCAQGKTGEYTIPNTVTKIETNAFYCSKLSEINIPNSVSSINSYAFYGSRIKNFDLPDSVTYIGSNAFSSNTDMENIVIPKSIERLDSDIFKNCLNLKEITILADNCNFTPVDLKCKNLQKIHVSDTHKKYTSIDGVLFNKNKTSILYFPEGRKGEYTVPDGVVSIGTKAFYSSKLESITFPDTLVRIEDFAFAFGCITNVTFPKSLKQIGDTAFLDCYIESVDIHENIISIGSRAFEGDRFKAFNVSENNSTYTSIDGVLFSKDKKTLICYPNQKSKRTDTYTIPMGTAKVASMAFYTAVVGSIVIPESVTALRDNAFEQCVVKTIVVPGSVTSIGSGAFEVFNYRNDALTIYAPLNSDAYKYAVSNKINVVAENDESQQSPDTNVILTPEHAISNTAIIFIIIASVTVVAIIVITVIIAKSNKTKRS
ncbi:MAG: leucine-rich repeat protein [Clostridia bacterium]|nr:leucine-rich repeat protein [Clostridia bacterium]